MANRRGEKIVVRAWGNRPIVRVIWDVCDDFVLVTSEQALALLEAGHGGPMPIGFSLTDVFAYEERKVEKVMGAYASGTSPQWSFLRHLTN